MGNFVAGIELIRQLINALEDSTGDHRSIEALHIKDLYSLERALLEVKHLDLDACLDGKRQSNVSRQSTRS